MTLGLGSMEMTNDLDKVCSVWFSGRTEEGGGHPREQGTGKATCALPSGLERPRAQTPTWRPSPSPDLQSGAEGCPQCTIAFPAPRPPETVILPH